jgi:hypothetical protein
MEGLVLGRVGHYHVPNSDSGYCQTALVVEADGEVVNLVAWTHTGDPEPHIGVPVGPDLRSASVASFHLTRDCPWDR